MARRKIKIEEFVSDVRGGMSDTALGKKFNLSQNQLEKLYDNLLKAGQLSPSDLDEAAPSFEPTVELAFTCAKCGALKLIDSEKCPQCGDKDLPEEKAGATQEFEDEESIPEFDPSAIDLDEEDAEAVGYAEEGIGTADLGTEDGGADSIFLEPGAEPESLEIDHGDPEGRVTIVHDLEPQLEAAAGEEPARTPIRFDLSPAESSKLPSRKPRRRGKTSPVALVAVLLVLIAAVGAGIYTKRIPAPDLAELPFIGTSHEPEVKTPLVAQRPWEKRKRPSVHREKRSAGKNQRPVHPRTKQARTAPEPEKTVAPKDKKKPRTKQAPDSSAEARGKSTVPKTKPAKPAETKKPTRVVAVSKAATPAPKKPEVPPEPVPQVTDKPVPSVPERKPEARKSRVPAPPAAAEEKPESRRTSLPGSVIESGAPAGGVSELRKEAQSRARKPEQVGVSHVRSEEPRPGSGAVRDAAPARSPLAARPTAPAGGELTAKATGSRTHKPDPEPGSPPRTTAKYGSPTRTPEPPSASPSRRTAALTEAVEPPRRPHPRPARVGSSRESTSFEAWLLEAAKKGQADVVGRLLENGVNANAKGSDGTTALMFAAGMGHLAVVRLLLKHGADVRSVNDQGITALAWAYSPPGNMGGTLSEQRRVVRLLKEYGASPVGAGSLR
jgi:ribosomal protein L40E